MPKTEDSLSDWAKKFIEEVAKTKPIGGNASAAAKVAYPDQSENV